MTTGQSIGKLLAILSQQQDPSVSYGLAFPALQIALDSADKEAAGCIQAYMDAHPGGSMGDGIRAFQAAIWWLMFAIAAYEPPPETGAATQDNGGGL